MVEPTGSLNNRFSEELEENSKNAFLCGQNRQSAEPTQFISRFSQSVDVSMYRGGLSILEVLVVISIITLLISLTFPAVQSARESSRRTSCQNKLRQLGLGIQGFEAAHRQYPPDGWGWVGDSGLAGTLSKLDGPGGWIHQSLPFIEQQALWELTTSRDGLSTAIGQPLDSGNPSDIGAMDSRVRGRRFGELLK